MIKNRNNINIFYSYGAPTLFFIALLLFYPLQFLRVVIQVPNYELLQVINRSTLSMLALALVFLRLEKLKDFIFSDGKMITCFFVLIAIAIYHYASIPFYNAEVLLAECIWLTVPLFAAIYYRELIRVIPLLFSILWLFNFLIALREIITGQLLLGVAGNWNWQACLLVMTTPIVVTWIWRFEKKWLQDIALLIAAISTLLFFASQSRGAVLSVLVICTLIILNKYYRLIPRHIINKCVVFILGCILLVALLIMFNMVKIPAGGVRVYLWRAGLTLISDFPTTGSGAHLYENIFTKYIPQKYYLEGFAAFSSTHPHNHLLYMTGLFGVIGGIAWTCLLLFPLVNTVTRLNRHFHWLTGCLLFSFLVMLFHSMLDLTFYAWPTNIVGLMILGIFWGMLVRRDNSKKLPAICTLTGACVGIFLVVVICMVSYREFRANVTRRNGAVYLQMQSPLNALNCFNQSLQIKPDKVSAYLAARAALYDLKNPHLALRYLKIMHELGADNYMHTNEMTGKVLYLTGKTEKARDFFYRELEVYPLSVRGWFYVMQAENKLGNKLAAEKAEKALLEALKVKGLTPAAIPLLLKNEFFDLRPREIPPEILMINGISKRK